ncbi:uncharacterized protein LOC108825521 [Raphanus sativus]|uniref:Uncharacterized protein LOC108825521 n=1 Tax=Raphanus sativus TaxID=3726 RepID=A0A9W3CEW6_RAPSA|nr:uncharacterized protein LOC108825521 [Raphanus sativus]
MSSKSDVTPLERLNFTTDKQISLSIEINGPSLLTVLRLCIRKDPKALYNDGLHLLLEFLTVSKNTGWSNRKQITRRLLIIITICLEVTHNKALARDCRNSRKVKEGQRNAKRSEERRSRGKRRGQSFCITLV